MTDHKPTDASLPVTDKMLTGYMRCPLCGDMIPYTIGPLTFEAIQADEFVLSLKSISFKHKCPPKHKEPKL